MKIENIDNGNDFDFGKTSAEYAKYRDIYPKELYDKLYEIGIGKLDIDIIDRVFEENKRQLSGITLPAKGLRLVEVKFE